MRTLYERLHGPSADSGSKDIAQKWRTNEAVLTGQVKLGEKWTFAGNVKAIRMDDDSGVNKDYKGIEAGAALMRSF